jgi:hypothetical protein
VRGDVNGSWWGLYQWLAKDGRGQATGLGER